MQTSQVFLKLWNGAKDIDSWLALKQFSMERTEIGPFARIEVETGVCIRAHGFGLNEVTVIEFEEKHGVMFLEYEGKVYGSFDVTGKNVDDGKQEIPKYVVIKTPVRQFPFFWQRRIVHQIAKVTPFDFRAELNIQYPTHGRYLERVLPDQTVEDFTRVEVISKPFDDSYELNETIIVIQMDGLEWAKELYPERFL